MKTEWLDKHIKLKPRTTVTYLIHFPSCLCAIHHKNHNYNSRPVGEYETLCKRTLRPTSPATRDSLSTSREDFWTWLPERISGLPLRPGPKSSLSPLHTKQTAFTCLPRKGSARDTSLPPHLSHRFLTVWLVSSKANFTQTDFWPVA